MTLIKSYRPFLFVLAAIFGLSGPAYAAPGDSAPTMGDDDDDDDEEEEEEEEGPGEDSPPPPTEEDSEEDSDEGSDEGSDEDSEEGGEAKEDESELDDRYRIDIPPLTDDEPAEEEEAEDESTRAKPARDSSDGSRARKTSRQKRELVEPGRRKHRGIVKVIQKKFFLKYRRLEVTPQFGAVDNDNFIRRFAFGASFTFHINDLLSLEAYVSYLPNLGETDYKPLTKRFRTQQEVVPDISRILFLGTFNVGLSPIYGKIELGTLRIINYDIYFSAGFGFVVSEDDVEIIQQDACIGNSANENARIDECRLVNQTHFVSNAGGGLRIVFNEWIGVRMDVRQFTHIEQVYRDGDIGLEMKQNFMTSIGASFFLPPKPRRFE